MRNLLFLTVVVLFAGCDNKGSSVTDPPVGLGAEEGALTITDNGLVLSWLEPNEGDILLKMSVHSGVRWSPAKTIAKGEDWFVNWADFPAIVANGDLLFAHFLQKSASPTFAYDVMYTISSDMGDTWSAPEKIHQDTVNAEHGFVSAVHYKNGFKVSWLDGRYTGVNDGAMTIRAAYVDENGGLHNAAEIDHSTCDCCQTSMTLVNGVPWSFYRNRTEDEIRDIYFSRLVDDNWSEPEVFHADNWLINACPVNGPVATSFENNIAVVWFTGAGGVQKVKLKTSADEGNSFGEVILVDGPKSFGRVDVQIDSAKIYVTFLTSKDDEASIRLKVYDHAGNLEDGETLAIVSPERGTGFPRTAIWHETLIISWTDVENHTIKILAYPLNKENAVSHSGLY